MAPSHIKCAFRLLTFSPAARPAVTARCFYTFRACYRVYRAVAPDPGVRRVQVQQLVPCETIEGPACEWRAVIDSRALGNVRRVANPGAVR